MVTVLGLGFCVRVRVIISIMGSVSYLNENFVIFLAFVAPSGECLGGLTAVCIATNTYAHGQMCACAGKTYTHGWPSKQTVDLRT